MSIHHEIIGDLNELRRKLDYNTRKKLQLEVYANIVARTQNLNIDAPEYDDYLLQMGNLIKELKEADGGVKNEQIRSLKKVRNDLVTVLSKEHNFVKKGKYMTILAIGGVFVGGILGFLVFDYPLLGALLGTIVGIGIGSKLDNLAKEDGIQI